ncbi:MAG: hypothetical protein MJY56_00700 [Bacteroidales bacterium]|nr:hypothetical protein [Bacteroidales bacterium]
MIPKTLHYCWFSKDRKPENVRKCIESWQKYLTDYEIKCWGPESFDFDSVPFVREAIAAKKWAFASDYIRLYALYNEGGIYLDSDVQVWDSIDEWLGYDFFTGLEMRDKEHTQIFPEAAIMGSIKGNPRLKEAMSKYEAKHFILPDGSYDETPIPTIMYPLLESKGWVAADRTQIVNGNCIILDTSNIANTNCERMPSVKLYHLNNRSWIPLTPKEKAYKLLKTLGAKKIRDFILKK